MELCDFAVPSDATLADEGMGKLMKLLGAPHIHHFILVVSIGRGDKRVAKLARNDIFTRVQLNSLSPFEMRAVAVRVLRLARECDLPVPTGDAAETWADRMAASAEGSASAVVALACHSLDTWSVPSAAMFGPKPHASADSDSIMTQEALLRKSVKNGNSFGVWIACMEPSAEDQARALCGARSWSCEGCTRLTDLGVPRITREAVRREATRPHSARMLGSTRERASEAIVTQVLMDFAFENYPQLATLNVTTEQDVQGAAVMSDAISDEDVFATKLWRDVAVR